ncbi:nitrogen fixation protein [Desulfuribacillus stibiiarsenatis]|uniref:Nitrogen fixation protein n=1 Tax=Desulfuribacillus stibiiarsenatis TaxID=1390249 RepID=A0A1E5L3F8_9FIRM|nr:P-II family nitrogen regulator [Desulfuribacillus stibiiarsenatis]OEH84637.1 nitrogen fixation protein [Desulfuribacillus stibiiarsenatis]
MKEIMAIIRMNKVAHTKKALVDAGFNGLTAMRAVGRGKMIKSLSELEKLDAAQEEIREKFMETILSGGRLVPKRLLFLTVADEELEKAIKVIIECNSEGNRGDGKIFVLPLDDVIRIRTGETGEEAV